ncbi:MAG: hypothetical protein AAF357_00155 [Verrucomicrobiota bacterium]
MSEVFSGSGKPEDVKNLELFDSTIFQDTFVTTWEVRNPTKRAWGINDLQNARIRLTLEFWSFDKLNFEEPPRFHNLHLYFGRESPHILYFTADQLGSPRVTDDSSVPIKMDFSSIGMDASPLSMTYEFRIDDEIYCNQIKQVG